jgi:hypothetical protein
MSGAVAALIVSGIEHSSFGIRHSSFTDEVLDAGCATESVHRVRTDRFGRIRSGSGD